MITRWLSAGVVIAAVGVLPWVASPVHAGHAAWVPYANYAGRAQFRPLSRPVLRQAPQQRWRPNGTRQARSARPVDRLGASVFDITPTRRPSAVTPPQRLPMAGQRSGSGTQQFRPIGTGTRQVSGAAASVSAPHHMFRPANNKPKPSYEQMMAQNNTNYRAYRVPRAAYPAISPPVFAPYWMGH